MINKNTVKIENYFEVFLITFLIGLFLFVIKDFILPMLLACSLVFLSYRPYNSLVVKTNNRTIPAVFILIMILMLVIFPMYWTFNALITETSTILTTSESLFENADFSSCTSSLCSQIQKNIVVLDISFDSIVNKISSYLYSSVNNIFGSVSDFFVSFFVFIFAFFFLLRDGEKFVIYVKRIIPMKNQYKNALFLRFRDVTRAVFLNTLLIALIQGSLVGFAFWILGFNSPVFWTIIASFAALLPLFGPSLVWIPAVIYLFVIGNYFGAGFLVLFGIFIIGTIDNILRPFLLNKKLEVHEFLILLSILGSMKVFGFLSGLFLGPIIVSLLISVLHLYNLDFDDDS